jgi:hypothetical protein
MSQHYYSANAFDTFLSAALTAGQSTLTVPENGADNGWPSTFPYYLQVDSGSSEEIVEVTSKGALASTRTAPALPSTPRCHVARSYTSTPGPPAPRRRTVPRQ